MVHVYLLVWRRDAPVPGRDLREGAVTCAV